MLFGAAFLWRGGGDYVSYVGVLFVCLDFLFCFSWSDGLVLLTFAEFL